MAATDVAAYTYNAEIFCPNCVFRALNIEPDPNLDAEAQLDRLARIRDIDRYDEHSFDSSEFPKVVFDSSLEESETCDDCWVELV